MIRHIALLFVMISILLASVPHLYAQYDLSDGCDARIQAQIAATTTLDYAGACNAYRTCTDDPDWGYPNPECDLSAVKVLMEGCALDDIHCRMSALLYSETILTLQSAPRSRPTYNNILPDDEILSGATLVNILTTFQQGDYANALTLLSNILFWWKLPFSKGIVYEAMGQNEQALQAYDTTLDYQSGDPLIHYARALLYSDMGKTTLASFEIAWLAKFSRNQADWQALIAPLVERYPLDTRQFTDWAFYPVMSYSYGSGGNVDEDNTLEAPHPVQIAFDNTDQAIFIYNFTNGQNCIDHCADSVLLTYDSIGNYFHGAHQYNKIYLSVSGSTFYGSATGNNYGGDSGVRNTFYLVPAGASDPRAIFTSERCGTLSRLGLGMRGESAMTPGLTLFDTPAGHSFGGWENGYYWDVTVIGGGKCIDNQMWWEVITPEGKVGWIEENSTYGTEPNSRYYFINPLHSSRQPANCRYATQRYCAVLGRITVQ
jgi:tetratricopeptide (TPR) repeat protein